MRVVNADNLINHFKNGFKSVHTVAEIVEVIEEFSIDLPIESEEQKNDSYKS